MHSLAFNFLIVFWAAVSAAIYLIEFVRWHKHIPPINRKPFNCEACLPVWLIAVFLLFAIYMGPLPVIGIAVMSTAGILTPLLIKLIQKL